MTIQQFQVGVYGVVLEHGKALLLRKTVPRYYAWCLPGGRIENDEMPYQTLVREFREELGLKNIRIGDLLHAGRYMAHELTEPGQFLALYFSVDASLVDLQPSSEFSCAELVSPIGDEFHGLNPNARVAVTKALGHGGGE